MYHNRNRQRGNMVIISVFIIVVMGLLATNLLRIKWSNQDTLTREYLGTQAWFLANSASEWALTELYPIGQTSELADLATSCTAININTTAVSQLATGLPCGAPSVSCTPPAAALPDELKYYQITSQAICSSGTIFQVQREQEIWIRAIEE